MININNKTIVTEIYWCDSTEEWAVNADDMVFSNFSEFVQYLDDKYIVQNIL